MLLNNDQLRTEMRAGRVFTGGWREAEIAFRPTYKFDNRNPQLYDQSVKRRIPSYTDRILWRTNPADSGGRSPGQPVPLSSVGAVGGGAAAAAGTAPPLVEVLRYDACSMLNCSDHKPVAAEFSVRFDGARDDSERESPALFTRQMSGHHQSFHTSARFGSSSSAVRNPSPRDWQAPASRTAGSGAQSSICAVM